MDIFTLFLLLASAILGCYLTYRYLRPRLISARELDAQTEKDNIRLQEQNSILIETNKELEHQKWQLQNDNNNLIIQKDAVKSELDSISNSISAMERQAQDAADLFYQSKMQTAQLKLDQDLAVATQKHQENIDSFQTAYEEVIDDLMTSYKQLSGNIAILKATNDAAVEAAKRAEEMKDNLAFYRIQLSDIDIKEIEVLRSIEHLLRDKEPLNKVIWKCYYEKPTTDMIGRVVGGDGKTGIYKITEIETGKCYVGQAANISDRWKQHIKRGVGAETPTRNKLYPAMNAAGPENFTFEVIEICDRAALDAREDYWQDYFKAKEFGYSIK